MTSITSVFDYLGEERLELNWTIIHGKVSSEGEKFPAVNFNAAKKNLAKISCDDKISSGEIRRGVNIMHQNRMQQKCHAAKFPTAKFPVAKLYAAKNPVFLVKIIQNH